MAERQNLATAMTQALLIIAFIFTIIAIMALAFFVFRSLFKIYLDTRNRVLGYKFRTKIVAIFVGIVLLPTGLLFFVASGLINNYIDKYFNMDIRKTIDASFYIAKTLYEREKQRTLQEAKRVFYGESIAPGFRVKRLYSIPNNASETIKEAFNGKEGAEVISTPRGDIIRAALPVKIGNKVKGVIVVEETLKMPIVSKAEWISETHRGYLTLYRLKVPLKANYFMALAFFTILIVFMALWASLKLSKWVADPVQKLAVATEEVSKGNLDVYIQFKRDDELGLLVNSFNKMVRELKEAKQSLETAYIESDRRRICLENILESINSGVISTDETGKIVTINSVAAKILNIKPELVLNKPYLYLLKYIEADELKDWIKKINLHNLTSTEKEFQIKVKGRTLHIRVFITPLKGFENKNIGLLAVFDDITDLLLAKQASMWKEVARNLAHEIKNPLTPIKLSTERLLKKWERKDPDLDRAIESATKTIIREVEGLQRLVSEFSRFGRIPSPSKRPTDLKNIISEVISLYDNIPRRFILKSNNKLPLVQVDPDQIKRALLNLVDNSIAATENDDIITIGLDILDGSIIIEVADTGSGIPDEVKDKLFVPHFSTKKDGTGLGLAIVHRIVTEHGGSIEIEENKPKGTKFRIKLPLQS